jgi:NADH:quinone reductase (non-electrogenic)
MNSHVVIIGGGFGGLEAAFSLKELLPSACTVTLVDRNAFHFFIPSIHEIVSGKTSAESIRIPFGAMLGPTGIRFVQDEMLALDRESREVRCRNTTLQYDYLVLSVGAENNFFGIAGAEEFSYCFRRPDDAEGIRNEVMRLLDDPVGPCHIVLAGGGTEGVETAGELLDLIKKEGREDDLKSGLVSIDLIEGKERLLTLFPAKARDIAEQYLRDRGVNVLTRHAIVEVRNNAVLLDTGERRHAAVLVWTGGIQPAAMIRTLPLQKDQHGWLLVTDRLHSPDDDRIYGIGDAVSISGTDGPLPLQRLAHHAQDQARVAALNIANQLEGRDLVAYAPKNKPQLISLGKEMGIFAQGGRVLSGPWIVVLKKAVERKYLMACLARPVSSALGARIPGAGLARRWRMRLFR